MFVQKATRDGIRLWGDFGVCVNDVSVADYQKVVTDGQGGVLNIWSDSRYSSGDISTLFFQHLDANGIPLLQPNGVPILYNGTICHGYSKGEEPDGSGGAFYLIGNVSVFYLIHLTGTGQMLWLADDQTSYDQYARQLLRHPRDGTFWVTTSRDDMIEDAIQDLYHYSATGQRLLPPGGLPYGGAIVPTDSGVITFCVHQTSPHRGFSRARRINNQGGLVWNTFVSTFNYDAINDAWVAMADGANGIVGAWNYGIEIPPYPMYIYAQHVSADGLLGEVPNPGPYAPLVNHPKINVLGSSGFRLSLPIAGEINLELFDVMGRKVKTLFQGYREAGEFNMQLDTGGLSAGVYIARLTAGEAKAAVKMVVMK
jgi:hypothetical protein